MPVPPAFSPSRWFLASEVPPALQVAGSYEPWLVALSIAVAVVASWAALQLAGQARQAPVRLNRFVALAAGSMALGAGVWAMHFIGMLAFQLCAQVDYSLPATLASMLPSLAASAVALNLIARRDISAAQHAVGGVLVGAGIGAMHYGGMLAMRMAPQLAFDPLWFAGSIVVAVVLAILALWIRHGLVQRAGMGGLPANALAGLVMGLAIAGMHYTGMAAARFIGETDPAFDPAQDPQHPLALAIACVSVVIGVMAVGAQSLLRFYQLNQQLRESEGRLRSREAQYRTLIANMPGVAFRGETGARTRLIFASDRIEGLTGWPAADFVAGRRSFDELVHPEDRQRARQAIADALAQDLHYAVDYRITRRDGQERWISETAGGVRDAGGQLQWIDGVMLDVTEARLRNAEFENVATALDRALCVTEIGQDGLIARVNDNALAMTGYRREELLGRHYHELLAPDYIGGPQYRSNAEAIVRGEVVSGEFLLLGRQGRPGGREIWVQGTYNPVFDEDGRLVKTMAFETDVTVRKRMERELRDAKARAEQAAAARSSFLANMSHEIRTPMNAILGFTDVLLNTALAPAQRRHLETVRQAAQSLLGLLNDILDTAKLEKGAVELEVADFSLRALCEQVAASMRLAAERKHLHLALDYPAVLPEHYRGDALRIQQILVNLVGNAIKFTQTGHVRIEVRQDASSTVVAVADTGIGIAPDRIDRIFDAFAQADATITRKFGGTGLGTTIARQLTELMGGRIVVQSEPGVGSRFEVRLPLAAGRAPAALGHETIARLPPLRVLAADDVPQNVELLELVLQADGHTVRAARNGQEAVELFERERFDLVLMDMHMPVMDGLSATRAMRALERDAGRAPTPVVALTASVQASDRTAAGQAGMDGFAAKPIVAAQLFGEIARVLGLQPPQQQADAAAPAPAAGVIDWTQGLALWRTPQRLRHAVAGFLRAQAGAAELLRGHLARQDYAALAALAHRISGAAGNLALADLRAAARRLERAARDREAPAADAGVQDVAAQLRAAEAALPAAPAADTGGRAAVPGADTAALLALLDRLEQALAGNALDEQALRLLAEGLPAGHLQPLLDAVDSFDFPHAVQRVQVLRHGLRSTATPAP